MLALYAGPLLCGRFAAKPRRWRAAGAVASLLSFVAVVALSYGEPRIRDTFRDGPAPWRPAGEGLP